MACHQEFPQVFHDGGEVGQQRGLGSRGCTREGQNQLEGVPGPPATGSLGESCVLPPASFYSPMAPSALTASSFARGVLGFLRGCSIHSISSGR